MNIIKFKSLDSTNQYLKENYKKFNNYQIIWAKKQTKGLGRKANTWYANENSLTFSFILKEKLKTKAIELLPIYLATIIHKVISQYNNYCFIKWPNDIYIKNKKLAGILIESIYQEKLQVIIIGIGINLNNQEFPDEIKAKTTSLKLETNKTYQSEEILKKIVKLFKQELLMLNNNPEEIINYFNFHHLLNGKLITYYENNHKKIGKCLKIDKNGHLIVNIKNKEIHLISGEIENISTK
ncbi:MAG: biotin--[acetyl-CoA-carboxylase] ligase [Bacillota bacterium]